MSAININALREAAANLSPFPHAIVSGFVRPESRGDLLRDFPRIAEPGSFPCASLKFGAAFADLIRDIQGEEMTAAVADKLKINLHNRPTMVTARGRCRAADGKIHCDSRGKLVTALIYLNAEWEADGGRLRLLNSADNLEDYFAEAPPDFGSLVLFRCEENAWHGHKSFEGERRAVQLNWVTDDSYRRQESRRHRLSAAAKKIGGMLRRRIGR